ncbi:MAG: exodeoxyribonuclease V subunit beta [Bacillota bacterium]
MHPNYFNLTEHELCGINLIEASAGTGKTYTISGLFLRLLLEKGLSVRDILVVTFTEAATEELKDRIRRNIAGMLDTVKEGVGKDDFQKAFLNKITDLKAAEKILKEALINFDEANIFTIHSFCRRMLNENAFESGILFDVELIKDDSEIRREITADYWRKHIAELPPYIISYLKNNSAGKIKFSSLLELSEKIEDLSDMRLIPEEEVDLKKLEADYFCCFEALKKTWNENSSEIRKIFSDTAKFNQVKYKWETIKDILNNLDKHLNLSEIPAPDFPGLKKFILSNIEGGLKKGQKAPEDKAGFFSECEKLSEAHDNFAKIIPSMKVHFIKFAAAELSNRKHIKNVQSFSDLLVNLREALRSEHGEALAENIRTKFKAALIDEFQDTDPVQFDIFQRLFTGEGNTLFLIGDPKQAIYGFRGADIFAYLRASGNTSYIKRTLGTNFRSQADLIKGVNLIFEKENPFIYEEIQYINVNAPEESVKKNERLMIDNEPYTPLHIWNAEGEASDEEEICLSTACEIKRLLGLGREKRAKIGEREIEEKDFAVLVKKNMQAIKMQKALTEAGIPSVIYNSGNIFDSHEASETECILNSILEPGNSKLVRAALITDIIGLTCEEIDKMTEQEHLYEEWLEKFREYRKVWHSQGFIKMFRELLSRENVMPRLMQYVDGERRNTNMLHLMELLHQSETETKLSPQGLIKWLSENINSEEPDKEEHQLRLESDEKAVKIITVHKSKGLEYSIVFLPFMWSTVREPSHFLFHDRNNGNIQTWELGSDKYEENKDVFRKEKMAEELRLFYVAVTRAKNCCYIIYKTAKEGVMNDIFSSQDELTKKSNGCIRAYEMPKGNPESITFDYGTDAIELRELSFRGSTICKSQIASYTSLIQGHADRLIQPEADIISEAEEAEEIRTEEPEEEEDELSPFTFPKGIRSGLCLHEILEETDFGLPENEELIRLKLKKYRIDQKFTKPAMAMVSNVLNTELKDGIRLKDITAEKRIHEMEFYFPMPAVSGKGLASIFEEIYSGNEALGDFYKYLRRLRQDEIEGFMNGLTDLFFEHEGKYYIADWKSNYLGKDIDSYSQGSILGAMKSEMYILQYHIYSIAAYQYLKTFSCEDKFGGVFYLFLRGIDPVKGSGYGVYFHRPLKAAIEKLSGYLTRGAKK